MASDRIITIKFAGNTKSLITEVAAANAALDSLGKKSPQLEKLAQSLEKTATGASKTGTASSKLKDLSKNLEGLAAPGDKLISVGRNLGMVETAITAVAKVGSYLKPMIGLVGLIPGAVAIAGAAFGVLKLGSAGIQAAFKGVGDSAKTQVAAVFQTQLAPAAKGVNTLLNALTPGLKGVASQMSAVAVATVKAAGSAANVKSLNTVLDATKTVVHNIGGALAPLATAFLTVAGVAAPMFAQLTAGATGWATKLQAKVQALAADGRLKTWIQGGIDRFVDFKNKIETFVKEVEPIAKNLGGIRLQLFDSLGPAIIPILTAVSGFLKANPNLALWIIGVGLAFKLLAPAISAVSDVMKILELDPIVLIVIAIVVAIAALVAGFIYLWNTSEGFRNFWIGTWHSIQTVVGAVVTWFQANVLPVFRAVWSGIQTAIQGFLTWADANIVPWFSKVWGQIQDAAKAFMTFWDDFWNGDLGKILSGALQTDLQILVVLLGAFKDVFLGVFNAIVDILKGVWDIISGVISGALQIIKGVFEVFGGLLTGNWSMVWDGIKDIVGGAATIIMGVVHGIGQVLAGLRDIAIGVGLAIGDAFSGLGGVLRSALNTLISIGDAAIHGLNAVTGLVGIPKIPDIPHLAQGGVAQTGKAYLVGENGPELFTPGRTGRVSPTSETADLLSGDSGGFQGDLYLTLDLGEGITKRIQISNRQLRAAVKAGR